MPDGGARTRWEQAPPRPRLRQNEVQVWRAVLATDCSHVAERTTCLSQDELLQAERFHFVGDRDRWLLSRSILRDLLGLYLGRQPSSIEILSGLFGKPFLAESRVGSGLRFNLSHSGNHAVYAFTAGREVGIDLERSVPLSLDELASAGFLSEGEVEELAALEERTLPEALLRCWTRKEAFIKATGEGMSAPLTMIEVPLAPGRHSLRRPLPGEAVARPWTLMDIHVAPGYAGCLAAEGEADVITWDWRWPGGVPQVEAPEWSTRHPGVGRVTRAREDA